MNPLLILLAGMVVVLGGILWLRLHAFLALLLGALTVAVLTPADSVRDWSYRQEMAELADDAGEAERARQEIIATAAADADAGTNFVERVATEFGKGCANLGILIAMAAIIGKCLLDSGAAERIVVGMRRGLGDERAPLAFTASGFLIGIPVFFDTVFYLLMPLGRALYMQTRKDYLLYILTIVAGGTMAHSLVPPTPGPLFVAAELDVDVGVMMLGGCLVGIVTASAGYAYAVWANRRWVIPLRPLAALADDEAEAEAEAETAAAESGEEREKLLPPLTLSLLPIVLPVALIGGDRICAALGYHLPAWAAVLGNKNIALIIAAAIGLALLMWQKRMSLGKLGPSIQAALASAGLIILVTSAGSAFGGVLRETGIDETLAGAVPESHLMILVLAFGTTTLVRIAQGSATVAMITAVGVVAPVVGTIDLPYHTVYIALAIGCGSKPILWMNDSGFWIMSRMSGMTEKETLKTVSVMAALMGFVGLIVVLAGALLLPLK